MKPLQLGDKVLWRGGFGGHAPKVARVVSINHQTLDDPKGEGTPFLQEVAWSDRFVVTLDNGHWAYSEQLEPI